MEFELLLDYYFLIIMSFGFGLPLNWRREFLGSGIGFVATYSGIYSEKKK